MRCDLAGAFINVFAGRVIFLLVAASAGAAPPAPDSLTISPDISVEFSNVTLEHGDVALDDLHGLVVAEDLGALAAASDVTGYHLTNNGDRLFSLDTTATLADPLTVTPGDVVRYDGVIYTIEFDADAEGIPNGVSTDAISQTLAGKLLLSFDTTVDLDSFTADDEDLIEFDAGSFALVFDGSAAGLDASFDLDGAHDRFEGFLALSFDLSGEIGGVAFDDEDVLQYDSGAGTWSMLVDYSAVQANAPPVDVDAIALPEPAAHLHLLCGIALLFALPGHRNPSRGAIDSNGRARWAGGDHFGG